MPRKGLLSLVAAVLFLLGAVSSAQATSPLEGVWSFNGGKVAVEANADGSFRGVIVAPTKFSQCFHPVGEEVWTDIRAQSDGSFWGCTSGTSKPTNACRIPNAG